MINSILEDTREENKTVWIVSQDMAKAFDSIRIITAYGLTDAFTARDGIDQGEVISPLIWRIFYDPLLHRIQEDESLGYSMELKWPYNTICNEKRNVRIRTTASVYADDTQWIAKSKNEARKITLIADEFFDINDIKINGEKSEIIVVNPEDNNEEERFIEIGKNRDKVTANKGSVPIRILGVWFKADKGDKHTEGIVKKEISTVLGAIRRKHITHMQAIYIINMVLLPRLEYRLKTTIWEDKKYEEIYKPIMKVVKHKTRLPINCHNNILLHSAQGNLKNLWRNQTAAQITEFLVALNSQSKQADMLKMRLKKAQLTLNITSCILMTDPDVTVPNKMLNNHAYNVIRKAHDYLFKIHPLVESEKWNIPIIGPDTNIEPSNSERETEIDREALINMQAFKMTKKMPSKDSRKKEFVYTHQDGTLVWGQIIKKNNKTGKFTIQHWVRNSNNQSEDSGMMQKVIQRCSGCRLNDRRVNKESYNCHFNRDYSDLACINRIFSCQNNSDTKVIKDIIETRKCPGRQCISEQISDRIQIQDYDTALIRNTVSNEEARTQHITLLHQLRSIFNPSNTIDIYTDGSLTDHFNTNLNDFTKHMGTGWVIINDKNEVILECSSSITDWPSSTRAELGAILSAILVLQTGQRANIFTDSQAAIDSINHTRINLTNGKNKIRIWFKGHSGVKGNEEADRVAKNDTGKSTCITINDSQQKDLKYDLYWDGKRVDRHIRKFIDNLCGSALEASWSFNRTHRTIFQDTTHMIEEKVTWAIFKKNTGFNCTTTTVNNNFIKHLKLTNNLLPTLEIMKERRYDLYGDVKCRLCLVENEDDDHIIYCQQLRDKWLIMANNTINKCEQMFKDFLSKKEYIQLNQEDIQQLHLWNRNFFVHTTGFNQELPIPFVHLMLRNLFPKGRYRELRSIVKSEKATLTIASLFLEMFITEFYKVIWQSRCDIVADWERTKGIKKQDLRKKISAQQRIVYERIPTQQVEDGTYNLKGRKIFKCGEQWSVALEKTRQYINQFIKNGNRAFTQESFRNDLVYWIIVDDQPFTVIANDWKLNSTVLNFSHIEGPHSGENIASKLFEVLREFKLLSKILGISTDNASNMDKMFSKFEYMCNYESIKFDGEAPENENEILQENIISSNSLRVVAKRKERFKRQCIALNMKPLELIPDIRTRWNSTFYMIERAFCLRECFQKATIEISSEKSPTLGQTVPIYNYLIDNIEDFLEEATRSDDIINAANNAKNKLQQYYPSSDGLVYVIATIIDLRHKLQYYIDNEFEVGSLAAYMFKKRKTSFTNELEAYLSEPPENFNMDVLAFWKVHENKFPNLFKMARDFLAIPGTSVPVERVFSGVMDLITQRRCSLNPEMIRKLMYLKAWLKYKNTN
ncbi:zinc finger BED domain-containing protein RICESLEEPER 2-like [Rhizophagus irregularis DAOM 181602=DAOM 197198]|nr:zinc finger BED domain-containing protein RICESLEEPER 2-like [Rhizophagus irregularis DAOM 181602=DAOM 197198]